MNNETNHDPLGTNKLAETITKLIERLDRPESSSSDPFFGMVTEEQLAQRFNISRSTLRQWRRNGTIKKCWVSRGNLILYKPEIMWQELSEIG